MKENSTIAAIATALSPAGISIIRISGPQALDVIDRIYRTKKRGRVRLKKRSICCGSVIFSEKALKGTYTYHSLRLYL